MPTGSSQSTGIKTTNPPPQTLSQTEYILYIPWYALWGRCYRYMHIKMLLLRFHLLKIWYILGHVTYWDVCMLNLPQIQCGWRPLSASPGHQTESFCPETHTWIMNINNGITFKKVPTMNIMHILEAKCVSSLHVSAGSSVVSARGALTHRQKADRHQLVLVIQHLIWSRSSLSSWKILYAPRHRL